MWRISDQTWDPKAYARSARFVSELGAGVVELLNPKPGERVLDLGCGDGELTQRLVERGCRVVAVDSSREQVAAARDRGIDAHVVDARKLGFTEEFDAVFTNAALHWFGDIDATLSGVYRSLVPGGRFVGEFGGAGNVETVVGAIYSALARRGIDGAALNPWYFPFKAEFKSKLTGHGFEVSRIETFPRPTTLPGNFEDWMGIFCKVFTAAVPESERSSFVREVTDALRPKIHHEHDGWVVDYVRLRFATHLSKNRS